MKCMGILNSLKKKVRLDNSLPCKFLTQCYISFGFMLLSNRNRNYNRDRTVNEFCVETRNMWLPTKAAIIHL
jgi:hypothetical protein